MPVHEFKTVDIKGKEYVQVNDRILYFRNEPSYDGWSIETELVESHWDEHAKKTIATFRAVIRDASGRTIATGHAREREGDGFINKTSYLENCETSAIGRALAMLGIGIETSIASSEEVQNAMLQQGQNPTPRSRGTSKRNLTKAIYERMMTAIEKGDSQTVKDKLSSYAENENYKNIEKALLVADGIN